ncbi:MAG: hypothetical protein ACT4OK_01570 [Gemmobacter sp.]
MMNARQTVDPSLFNPAFDFPYQLRTQDFQGAMQDVYDFFFDVNGLLLGRGLERLDDMLRPAAMTGILSDLLTASVAKQSRVLRENGHHNGHPDLVLNGVYANNSVASGDQGVEIKSTRKPGGAVDTHGARNQWMCVFVYRIDNKTQPKRDRRPMKFTEVHLAKVEVADFRQNARGVLGTRTATLHAQGLEKLRRGWIYLDKSKA